jgi:hypothetical protein
MFLDPTYAPPFTLEERWVLTRRAADLTRQSSFPGFTKQETARLLFFVWCLNRGYLSEDR